MLLAICEKKLAIFAPIANYFRQCVFYLIVYYGCTAGSLLVNEIILQHYYLIISL